MSSPWSTIYVLLAFWSRETTSIMRHVSLRIWNMKLFYGCSQHSVHTLGQSNTLWLSDYFKISFGAKFYCLNPFDIDFYSNKSSVSSFQASTVKNGRPNFFHWLFKPSNTSKPKQPVFNGLYLMQSMMRVKYFETEHCIVYSDVVT